jgi:AbrB family looped-hinge helix DNA binding protein
MEMNQKQYSLFIDGKTFYNYCYQIYESKTFILLVGIFYGCWFLVETVRVSGKGQVVIPKSVRDRLGLRAGDELSVNVQDGKIVLRKRPESYTDYMWGLHGNVWKGVDAMEYVDREREAWLKKKG